MRQEVTRMHKGWALDNVTLHNEVLKMNPEDCKTPPKVGVTIIHFFVCPISTIKIIMLKLQKVEWKIEMIF